MSNEYPMSGSRRRHTVISMVLGFGLIMSMMYIMYSVGHTAGVQDGLWMGSLGCLYLLDTHGISAENLSYIDVDNLVDQEMIVTSVSSHLKVYNKSCDCVPADVRFQMNETNLLCPDEWYCRDDELWMMLGKGDENNTLYIVHGLDNWTDYGGRGLWD